MLGCEKRVTPTESRYTPALARSYAVNDSFLDQVDARKSRWRDRELGKKDFSPAYRWTGPGKDGLEVAYGTAESKPNRTVVREIWKGRHGYRAAPLLVVVAYPGERPNRAAVCGPTGENPTVVDLDLGHAERMARAALREPHRHLAIRFLAEALEGDSDEHPGLRNKGLLATHELLRGVPERADWADATVRSEPLLRERGQNLVQKLGYEIEARARHSVLRSSEGRAQAVAVFLQDTEQADQPTARFENQTPVTYALSHADRDNLPWVVAERGGTIRLYSTSTSGAAGQRGRAETFVELNLPLLPSEKAGYLQLLFSSSALAEGGTISEIQQASSDYASELSARLRERVYKQVVPRLAVSVADQVGGTDEGDLERHYRTALTILFRLMFAAYAEDSRLLPLHINGEYTDHALKTIARRLSDEINNGRDLGFYNPFTEGTEEGTDTQTDLWDSCRALFHAVDTGHVRWGVPAYNGGLFSTEESVNPVGAIIEELSLTNAEFGPALTALIVDRSPDGDIGPIDFRSLSVREFGTIYEGLLESELSVAEQPLAVNSDGVYLGAGDRDEVLVEKGEVYLHNQSGVRKSTGSYFTKPFAVDHLITHSVDQTLGDHLDRARELLDAGKHADAAEMLFDFRVADIAMGSGHFLTAVVDRLEARYTTFLAENPIPEVSKELDLLRKTANEALGQLADTVEIENSSLLRRLIARRCVYGVDLNPLSVELARVGMWIHTFVPGLPLSFLDHNLAVGNSLTGIGTIDEAVAALANINSKNPVSLFEDPLKEALQEAEEPLRRLARITDATVSDIADAREAAAEAVEAIASVSGLFDLIIAERLGEATVPSVFSAEELFDLDFGHARKVAKHLQAFHFPIAFPEVFLRERSGFDVIVGNPPWDKVRHEPQQFWAVRAPGLLALSEPKQKVEIARLRLERPLDAQAEVREVEIREQLQSLIDKAFKLQGKGQHGHHDFAKLFVERALAVQHDKGTLGYVLPRTALVLGGWTDLRKSVLDDSQLAVLQARNKQGWLFGEVDSRLMIILLTRTGGNGPVLIWPGVLNVEQLKSATKENAIEMTRAEIDDLTDKAVIPWFGSPDDQEAFDLLRSFPRLGRGNGWITGFADSSRWDFSTTGTHKHFVTDIESKNTWRVLMTRHVDAYRIAVEDKFRRFVNQPRDLSVLHLGVETNNGTPYIGKDHPAIVYRYPSRSDDARTVIATVLPNSGYVYSKGYVHGVRTPSKADIKSVLALLGLMNSFICDWWVRRFVDRHVTKQVLESIPLPKWNNEDISEVSGHVAALLVLSGITELAGNRSIIECARPAMSSDEHVVGVELAVMRGFQFSKSELRSILLDFSIKGCPPDLRARLVEEG